MAIVSAAQRTPTVRPGRTAPPPSVGRRGEQLAARLREIGQSAPCPEDALDPMLQVVLESSGATAGALCLYDVGQQVLRLAAEIGLSDDGCRQLRTVGSRTTDSWGMPLHGMLNRRGYLIENAARNRFVPPLVEDAAKVSTVACLPLYNGATPLASLVLITRAPRTLGEREIQTIEAPMREIGRLIETMRQRALGRGSSPPTAVPAGVPATVPGAGVPSAQARAADLLADLERLRVQLGELEAGAARERRAREEIEACLVGEVSNARRRLLQAEEVAQEAQRARAVAVAETARLHAELEQVRRGARAETSGVSARLAAAEARLEARLETLREEHAIEVRSLGARLRAVAAEAERLRAAEGTVRAERDRLAADLEGATAARKRLEEALKGALEEARAQAAEAMEQLRAARVQAWDATARLTEAETLLAALRQEHAVTAISVDTGPRTPAPDGPRTPAPDGPRTLVPESSSYPLLERSARHETASLKAWKARRPRGHRCGWPSPRSRPRGPRRPPR